MPGQFDVYVFEDGGTFYVRPAVAMVSRSDEVVKVRNLTDHPVEIRLSGPIGGQSPHVTIPSHETANIGSVGTANGVFDYCVDVVLDNDPHHMIKVPALGNSFPKIIVDP